MTRLVQILFQSRSVAIIGLSLFFLQGCQGSSGTFPVEAKFIAVQHNGQVKSFESYAQQTLTLISEKTSWDHKSATQALLEAISHPEHIDQIRWIKVSSKDLRAQLGLSQDRPFFSYEDAAASMDKIVGLAQSSRKKRQEDVRPSLIEQKAETLYAQLVTIKNLGTLETLRVFPNPRSASWMTPLEADFGKSFTRLLLLVRENKMTEFREAVQQWNRTIATETNGRDTQKIRWEVLYHDLAPFHGSWIAYLLAFLMLSIFKKTRKTVWTGLLLVVAALALHTTGIVLRVLILGRPPVSNMYESVIYMNWALMIIAAVIAILRRQTMPLSIGALLSAVIMIYGDLLPIDSSLEVLVPVLRSNYWLTVHVMTIVSSYGVFALAMGLGHRHLLLDLRKKLTKKEAENSKKMIIRTIQIGTLLIGIGTVLGGVWANESWGRFWGWDPKETWALITFLGYLIIIHLSTFDRLNAFGLAVGSIVGFQLVLMTWYGVNFVLGRGLHSYGQGSGGAHWIIYYLVAETLFLAWVYWKRSIR